MDYPKLIGFIGRKSSGKDTSADYLIERYNYYKVAFGDPVKNVCKQLFLLSNEQLTDHTLKETIDNRWGISPRVMFQRIGTEFGQDYIFRLFPELKNTVDKNEYMFKPIYSIIKIFDKSAICKS